MNKMKINTCREWVISEPVAQRFSGFVQDLMRRIDEKSLCIHPVPGMFRLT